MSVLTVLDHSSPSFFSNKTFLFHSNGAATLRCMAISRTALSVTVKNVALCTATFQNVIITNDAMLSVARLGAFMLSVVAVKVTLAP
jgi:hypothetical protein